MFCSHLVTSLIFSHYTVIVTMRLNLIFATSEPLSRCPLCKPSKCLLFSKCNIWIRDAVEITAGNQGADGNICKVGQLQANYTAE